MKKMKYLALMSAIALTSAVGFTACSSSDEVSENKPVIDSKDFGKGVVTQFALNIGSASGTTRSTPNVAQQNNYFRGIQDIYLIPMDFAQTTTTGWNFTNYVNNSNENDIQNTSADGYSKYETIIYHLGDISNTSSMEDLNNNVYKRIYSLTLPVGTNNFLFYGRAKSEAVQAGDGFDSDANALNGVLTRTLTENTTNAAGITFTLRSIESTSTTIGSAKTFLLGILNAVAQSKIGTAGSYTYWSKLNNSLNKNKTLLQAYKNFTTIEGGELRAGSAEAIRATLQELYRTVLAQERYGEDQEVKDMAKAIRDNLDNYFNVYFAAEGSTTPFAGTPVAADAINNQTGGIYDYDNDYYKPYLKYKETDKNKINFPVPQGLPSGVVNLTFNSSETAPYGAFSYNGNSTVVVTTAPGTATNNFTFPAELTYYANSALRASDISKEANDYPTGASDWDDPANAKWSATTHGTTLDWGGKVVTADTRSVAMKNRVFYGVSQLQSSVKLAITGATLNDNRKKILNDGQTDDQSIAIDGTSFILTGILIGQQPDEAGWNFLPTSNNFNKVIYDRILPTGVKTYYTYPTFPEAAYSKADTGCNFVTTAGTAPNYTLVLDNYNSTDTQDDVSVALEFINNTGKDFYGRDNVIPAGGTFYLVGKLNKPATGTIQWDEDYNVLKNEDYKTRIPAYGKDRVFVQDHTTVAQFKIGDSALKNAYNTIPDLRTVQMLFGLSVDLKWRTGISYTDDNGGSIEL